MCLPWHPLEIGCPPAEEIMLLILKNGLFFFYTTPFDWPCPLVIPLTGIFLCDQSNKILFPFQYLRLILGDDLPFPQPFKFPSCFIHRFSKALCAFFVFFSFGFSFSNVPPLLIRFTKQFRRP